MASIFNCETDLPRVSSPWLASLASSPRVSQCHTPASVASSNSTVESQDGTHPVLLSEYSITKLAAEPQMGPTEYKLHLLLRPRRQFKTMSTYQHGAKYTKQKDGTYTPALASSNQSRQDRLQHLTTQLLWRLQQSSPQHTGISSDTVIPRLPSDDADLDRVVPPEKLPPGLEESRGALYEIGVSDDGTLVGLTKDEMDESIKTLRTMATSLRCKVEVLRMIIVGDCEWTDPSDPLDVKSGKLWVAEAFVTPGLNSGDTPWISWGNDLGASGCSKTDQLRVTLTGPTTSGKSTLLGTLTTGTLDNGRGMSRQSLLKHRHEVESGMTSTVAQELIGYKKGTIINYQSHYNDGSWGEIHELSKDGRLVFVSDSAGHPRYRRTTLRGLVGWAPHWTVLCVAADYGESCGWPLSGENTLGPDLALAHLELCLKLQSPLAVVITKLDKASKPSLQRTLGKILTAIKTTGRMPRIIQPDQTCHATLTQIPAADDVRVKAVTDAIARSKDFVKTVPILLTSAVKGQGIGMMHSLLQNLPMPPVPRSKDLIGDALNPEQPSSVFHIDDVFNVPVSYASKPDSADDQHNATGTVVSGYLRFGTLQVNDEIVIGPFPCEDDDDSDTAAKKAQDPQDQPSSGDMGLSVSHPASSELARIALGNSVFASHVESKWYTARIASIRNLRLPVAKLLAGQAGTIGIIVSPFDNEEPTKLALPNIRRGMVVAVPSQHMKDSGISLQAASSLVVQVSDPNAEKLSAGALVNVYDACVRSAARVRKVTKVYVGSDRGTDSDSDGDGFFGMDNESEEALGDALVEVTLDLLSSREWVEMGSQVTILEGGAKDRTGLEGNMFSAAATAKLSLRTYASLSAAATAARNAARVPLLLPIPLYRRLLRAHRLYLPTEMRLLGDEYVKAEFRAHRELDNPAQVIGFLTEWQMYLQQVEGDKWKGEKMDFAKIQRLSEDQMVQLYELMQSIKNPSTTKLEDGETPANKWMKS
ncbi:hypothetical protein TD95_004740 [Thielaviopsis punctulata]|uniref:Tr-type G domain-containing protein n=1 Tax=Thielaviopsis punctulata TaxID=72032 RepID=A0A0F4ZA35_9PEZI|nr:hypothetical protein TD95_004740 [Thielaviopsis punctulata]